ncbi:MAG: tetratricopeptide repeat protein [Prevotella sp.]|nr:tetratricopeptide repeat protein [Prevotella sp.]
MKRIFNILFLFAVSLTAAQAQSDRQLIREGNKLYRSAQYAQAETTYRKALNKNPENARAIYNLGCALMKQGNHEDASEQFTKVGNMDIDHSIRSLSYYNKGVMNQKKKDYAQAIEDYKNALRLDPKNDDARKNLIQCKNQQKQQQQQKQQEKDNKNNRNKHENKKDEKQDENQKQDKQQNDKEENKQEQKEQMSKQNAEQLLNAAMQEEKATQQRLKKAMQQPRSRKLDKNW